MCINGNSEIKDNIIDFFNIHAETCMKLLESADSPDVDQIYEYNSNIIASELKELFAKTDILILTANKYETNILHIKISEKLKENKKTEEKIYKVMLKAFKRNHFFYFFRWGKYRVVHIMADTTGSNTVGGAEDMIRLAFQYEAFQPLAVISFGICFGIDCKTQRLGNVIISEKIYSYGVGIKIVNNDIIIKDDNNFKIQESLLNNIYEMRNINVISESNGEFIGNYITGEAVMSSEVMKQKVVEKATLNKVSAGEMEGYGIFKECTRYGRDGGGKEKVPCIIIKAICDWGAQKNGFMETFDIKEMDENKKDTQKKITQKNINIIKTYLQKTKQKYVPYLVEDIVKNSIQAFAVEKAFETCDKLFNNESYVFGIKYYEKACNIIQNYAKKGNKAIYKSTLLDSLKFYYDNITEEEVDLIIKQLCNDVLNKMNIKDMYKINNEKR